MYISLADSRAKGFKKWADARWTDRRILTTLRLRLRGLSLALAISAILGTGMLVSACGTVAGAGQDGTGNIRAWLQY